MFSKETYMARRAKLKQTIGSGLLLFLGNDESGMNVSLPSRLYLLVFLRIAIRRVIRYHRYR